MTSYVPDACLSIYRKLCQERSDRKDGNASKTEVDDTRQVGRGQVQRCHRRSRPGLAHHVRLVALRHSHLPKPSSVLRKEGGGVCGILSSDVKDQSKSFSNLLDRLSVLSMLFRFWGEKTVHFAALFSRIGSIGKKSRRANGCIQYRESLGAWRADGGKERSDRRTDANASPDGKHEKHDHGSLALSPSLLVSNQQREEETDLTVMRQGMQDKCFQKCVPVPGAKLSQNEQV